MKGRTISLVGAGYKAKRLVAVIVPSLREHCTFEIDDAPAGRKAVEGYLDALRSREPNQKRAKTLIAGAVIAMAGRDEPDQGSSYLNAYALTELIGCSYAVIEICGRGQPPEIKAIAAESIEDAKSKVVSLLT